MALACFLRNQRSNCHGKAATVSNANTSPSSPVCSSHNSGDARPMPAAPPPLAPGVSDHAYVARFAGVWCVPYTVPDTAPHQILE